MAETTETGLVQGIRNFIEGPTVKRCGCSVIHYDNNINSIIPNREICNVVGGICSKCPYLIKTLDSMKKKICLDNTSKDKYFLHNYMLNNFPVWFRNSNKEINNTLKRILELTQEEYEQKLKSLITDFENRKIEL